MGADRPVGSPGQHLGHSTYPDGSDPEEPFLDIVGGSTRRVLHHGAEIALLRDLTCIEPNMGDHMAFKGEEDLQ